MIGIIMSGQAAFAENSAAAPVKVTVTPSERLRSISPYIYGVNFEADLNAVSAKSIRMGGNRMSAYNWETNMSNAGSDYRNYSDMYVVRNISDELKEAPAGLARELSGDAKAHGIPYTLLTLQMLGYVSADANGEVSEENAAPSDRWAEVKNRKDGEFADTPDKTDGIVYMDEYLNYLSGTLGKSDSETGIKGYELDNEPALWSSTHSLVQRKPLTCAELVMKSIDLAKVVKDVDEGADVFGPSLYGYAAFDSFQGASDWENIKNENGYRWFVDYYLDEMKMAEDSSGKRLLDVLDLHFYTEAKGPCGQRSCNHYDNDGCVKARLNSVRALYDDSYRENSWITSTGAKFFPLLPNVRQSIDKYYPGTKISFTEYNFGGGDHISGAVAQADTLGIFAENDVYFATIWAFENSEYQFAAINMFTNYDGKGSGFGDTLIKSECESKDVSVYSSVDGEDDGTVKIIVTNRSLHEETSLEINLSSDNAYESAEVYSLYGDSADIRSMPLAESIEENTFTYSLPPLSVTEFTVRKTSAPETSESSSVSESVSSSGNALSSGSESAESVESASKSSSTVWIVISAAGGIIAAVAVIMIVKKKKK